MYTRNVTSGLVSTFLFLNVLMLSCVVSAQAGTPMMGQAEHRAMMGYGYAKGNSEEEVQARQYMQPPYGGWMGYGPMGPGMMGYGQMGPGMMGHGQLGCDQMSHGRMGSGMMGFGNMDRGMAGGMWGLMHLDLTDEQEEQIRKIHSRLRRENWAVMGEVMEQQDKLAELYGADTPDPKAIGKVYTAIFDLKRQKIENAIAAQNEIRALLSDEQRKDFGQRRGYSGRHMRGYGAMW